MIYLLSLIVFAVIMKIRHADVPIDSVLHREEKARFFFGFLLVLLLLLGDSFHLVPRIMACFRERSERLTFFLGLGNLISSITMTIFYNILIRLGDSLEYSGDMFNLWTEQTILWLTVIRLVLLLFPQNAWFSGRENIRWAVIRNVPFILIGVMTVFGFVNLISHAVRYGASFYIQIIAAVTFSFLFYLPAAIFGRRKPVLGMLMIPKTLCCVWMLAVVAFC